jgi:Fur family transcriptional regulator, ferric uptake regulator
VTAPRTTPVARIAFDDAVEQVRQGGGRITRARLELLKDLYAHGGRVTAEELAERHVDIDPATVYRSLSHFEEVGVVEHVHLGHGPAAYRWVGQRTVTAVCEECGAVTDIPASELDNLAERLEQRYGVRLSIGHFALSARCTACVTSGVRPQA